MADALEACQKFVAAMADAASQPRASVLQAFEAIEETRAGWNAEVAAGIEFWRSAIRRLASCEGRADFVGLLAETLWDDTFGLARSPYVLVQSAIKGFVHSARRACAEKLGWASADAEWRRLVVAAGESIGRTLESAARTILICGSRGLTSGAAIRAALEAEPPELVARVLHGACRGADVLASAAAEALGLEAVAVPADWSRYGRSAGPKRNAAMLEMLVPGDEVWAFHPDIENSRGTKDMVARARQAGYPVRVFETGLAG